MSLDLGADLDLAVRLVIAAVLGAIIGLEREIHEHPAGMRTHLLVSLGSAAFTVLSIGPLAGPNGDPGRVAAQIVSGIGFLGAGAILKEGATIRGLTTAASLWSVAAVGMAVGAGSWLLGVVVTIIVVLSLWPLRRINERFVGRLQHRLLLRLQTDDPTGLARVVEAIDGSGAEIAHLATTREPGRGSVIEVEARMASLRAGMELTSRVADLADIDLLESRSLGD